MDGCSNCVAFIESLVCDVFQHLDIWFFLPHVDEDFRINM